MRKKTIALLLSASLLSVNNTAQAADACEIVLCMFGKMKGASQSECKSAEKEYFSIKVFKKGKFQPSRTARERLKMLNKCPSPENKNINKMFGNVY